MPFAGLSKARDGVGGVGGVCSVTCIRDQCNATKTEPNQLIVSFHVLQHSGLCECHPFIFMTGSNKVERRAITFKFLRSELWHLNSRCQDGQSEGGFPVISGVLNEKSS